MKKILLASMLAFSAMVDASTVSNTTITDILAGEAYGDIVFLKISPKPSDAPTCLTNPEFSYAFDSSTNVGKVTLSIALSAYAAGKPVYLNGYDECTLFGGVENLRQIQTK